MHRRGPWKVDPGATNIKCEVDNAGCVREDHCDGMHLALVFADGDISMEQAKANARLIAAAPELLEACKEWVEIDGPTVSLAQQRDRWVGVVGKMKAAIAKATGGEVA